MGGVKLLFVCGAVSLTLLACVNKEKETDFGIGNHLPTSLINEQIFFSPLSSEYSFPVWFNDSIVSSSGISQIIHTTFTFGENKSILDSADNLPAKKRTYTFRKNGTIERVSESVYFDNRPISELHFRYISMNKADGFANVQIDSSFLFQEGRTMKRKTQPTAFYQLKKSEKSFRQYYLGAQNRFLYLIADKKPWGPLKIKRTLNPKPTDKILLGNAYYPQKIYSVKNTIEEFNVTLFSYQKKVIYKIEIGSYPLKQNRTFQYDRRGYCIRYIDSLFSDQECLSRTVAQFTNNMQFFPTQITHMKENMEGVKNFYFKETFEYVYRK